MLFLAFYDQTGGKSSVPPYSSRSACEFFGQEHKRIIPGSPRTRLLRLFEVGERQTCRSHPKIILPLRIRSDRLLVLLARSA